MSKENPWKKTGSRPIFENPWISLTEFQIINPVGNPGTYSTIHFKNLAVGIIAIDDADNIALIGQYRFPIEQYSWEVPAGGCPVGTDPLESAKRELLEETGLLAENWAEIQRLHLSNSVSDELAIIYLAEGLTQKEAQPEETELLEYKKVPFEEALKLVLNGEITDSISVAAILKVKCLRTLPSLNVEATDR
ncbi:NUDIX hydrolase [Pseudopedobacter saltans DSM 12145]|uniref:GDP-mannose pyrophosphatase n=1 Tax=Pseudopedobacter saltans (strain ATCC 51119 / DSM 12145 / JCM 21818 / CCUG 39354 / LMG 10337 / NBRC 100064 / NCIMB 13643) TaxID=762903 RepID=F0S8D4_PSESL|nr:NUDIX hydrolase [Pseudopedobacter saltans]ADY53398.1 NUDIX hydrolase [Pseudopedobacter saltans DSM 12145]